MLTALDCIPCFLRQALEAARFATKDEAVHEQVIRHVLRMAAEMDLMQLVEVIENGSDAPGTILSDCSKDFRKRFAKADMIIAKGQSNFETLSDAEADIFFLFKVKCPVIAAHVGLPVGTHVLTRSRPYLLPQGAADLARHQR